MKPQIHNGQLVAGLMEAMLDGERSLSSIPKLVKKIISERMWEDFYIDRTKQHVNPKSFMEFVSAQPMEGLGIDLELLERICRDDEDAMKLIHKVTIGSHGGDRKSKNIKIDNVNLATPPNGNARQHALRKLRKDRPDLHAQVLAKKLSPHAAMIEAGYRVKSMTIPADPTRAAQYLKRRFTKTEFDAFKKELLT